MNPGTTVSKLRAFRKALAGTEDVDASQFKSLDLDELAARDGERWPDVKACIFATCQSFIEKRIGPEDLMMPAADGFLVLPAPSRRGRTGSSRAGWTDSSCVHQPTSPGVPPGETALIRFRKGPPGCARQSPRITAPTGRVSARASSMESVFLVAACSRLPQDSRRRRKGLTRSAHPISERPVKTIP